MVHGQVTHQDTQSVLVDVAGEASRLSTGDRVVIAYEDADLGRVSGTIEGIEDTASGQQIQIACASQHDRDKRDFPRMVAGLPIRYRVAAGDAEVAAWKSGEPVAEDGWFTPDPFMNFSVGGLRFEADTSVVSNDLLLVDFAVSEAGPRWRLTARVIRVFEPENESESTHPIAVAFVFMTDAANEALSELTLKIQETLL